MRHGGKAGRRGCGRAMMGLAEGAGGRQVVHWAGGGGWLDHGRGGGAGGERRGAGPTDDAVGGGRGALGVLAPNQ